jgi:tetratricopeptide (TPR) repeat protein
MRLVVAAMFLLLASPRLFADEAEVAREHFSRGTTLYNLGRFGDAAREYERAYEAKQEPALLFNIAQAYRFDGQKKKALFAYRAYLRSLPDAHDRTEVEARIAALERDVEREAPARATAPPRLEAAPTRPTAPSPEALVPSPQTLERAVAASPRKKPAYQRWWPWTLAGVVVAGAAVGIAVGVTASRSSERVLPPLIGNP